MAFTNVIKEFLLLKIKVQSKTKEIAKKGKCISLRFFTAVMKAGNQIPRGKKFLMKKQTWEVSNVVVHFVTKLYKMKKNVEMSNIHVIIESEIG